MPYMINKITNGGVPVKKLIILFVASILVVGCAHRSNQGNTAYVRSAQTESNAQKGVRYLLGRGVPQDDTKAFNYFLVAAKNDDPFAQNEVAYMYAAGKGTERDYRKAFEYYQKAANHGLASAQYNLGLLYAHGLGTAPNVNVARYFFQQASMHGFEPAKQALVQYGSQ
jgi:TPR repeat protein